MGDVLSHATLPGVALAFLLSVWLGGGGKSLPLLLAGAAITGLLGCGAVQFIRDQTRIKDDAAMGIVLSVFFGAGVVLLGFIQSMPQGSAAGLESFIYGKTASMVRGDFSFFQEWLSSFCSFRFCYLKNFVYSALMRALLLCRGGQ